MQASVPELMDVRGEDGARRWSFTAASRATARSPPTACWPGGWPSGACVSSSFITRTGTITAASRKASRYKAKEIDRACMALITDLKQRGMFDDTLIVWAGEFGRTPMSQGGNGRDHHNKAMSVWLAGGGVRGGMVYGATDDLGYAAVENVCTVHDLHATMLHQLGIEHEAFSVKFQGLDARLTGVEGRRSSRGSWPRRRDAPARISIAPVAAPPFAFGCREISATGWRIA